MDWGHAMFGGKFFFVLTFLGCFPFRVKMPSLGTVQYLLGTRGYQGEYLFQIKGGQDIFRQIDHKNQSRYPVKLERSLNSETIYRNMYLT